MTWMLVLVLVLDFAIALLLLNAPAAAGLRFNKVDGTFTIVQFTDLHFGEHEELDKLTQQAMARILEVEKPDFVALSGDMVSGYAWNRSQGWYKEMWSHISDVLDKQGIPYGAVLGNHDAEADLDRRQVAQLISNSGPLSITGISPEGIAGATNYYLDIQAGDGSQQAAARMWMLDSMDQGCEWLPVGWGCVARETLNWAFDSLDGEPDVPSLAFVHIPVPQFMYAHIQGPTNGTKAELVNCPTGDWHSFQGLKDLGVTAVYSGHDHDNDYIGAFDGVRLAYGRKSGFGSYGPPRGWLRGARVIVLREGQDPAQAETYLRLEDGSRVDQAPAATPVDQWFHQFVCRPGFIPLGLSVTADECTRCTELAARSSGRREGRPQQLEACRDDASRLTGELRQQQQQQQQQQHQHQHQQQHQQQHHQHQHKQHLQHQQHQHQHRQRQQHQ